MKNLKQKFVFAFLIALLTVWGAPRAEAWVKVTVTNNRSHTISIAFCWVAQEPTEDTSKGWYNVKAGETRTITVAEAVSSLTMLGFGYYAKGGKAVWSGKESDEGSHYMSYWIHPTKSFTGGHWGYYQGRSVSGGEMVYFRRVYLKKTGDRNMDATAAFTFN